MVVGVFVYILHPLPPVLPPSSTFTQTKHLHTHTPTRTDLSILDALCGLDGNDMAAAAAAEVSELQSDDEDDDESYDGDGQPKKKRARRTRTELNEIEKQRTRRINEQIHSLRALLEASGLNCKKDKFSILKK